MKAEVVLRRRDTFVGGGFRLCADSVFRMMTVPNDTRKIVLVFSDKPMAEAFTITRPSTRKGECLAKSHVKEFGGTLYYSTRVSLAVMYRQGYRYVRIEY